MNKLLLVIDLQNDFINENTQSIVFKINELVSSNKFDNIVFTKFINHETSRFYKELNYKGCLTEEGQIIPIDTLNNKIIKKDMYSALTNELREYILANEIKEIYICGIDTDSCVLKTAFDLFENNYCAYVLKDYCACTHGIKNHANALEIIGRSIGRNHII